MFMQTKTKTKLKLKLKLKPPSVIYLKKNLGDILCAWYPKNWGHNYELNINTLDNEIITKCIIIGIIS